VNQWNVRIIAALLSLAHYTLDFKQAFKTEFAARYPDLLLSVMDQYPPNAPTKYYNRSLSIIQSSGMGKSRLVDHSAKSRFTFPINLHEKLPLGSSSMYFFPQFDTKPISPS